MAGGYLDSLVSSWGGVPNDGPDPSRLEGLLELARQRQQEGDLGDLHSHMQRMRDRIDSAGRDRSAALESRRSQLHPALVELLERNIASTTSIVDSLNDFMQGNEPDEALNRFEAGSQEFLTSSRELAELATGSEPLCPRCGSRGPEPLCAECQLDRLVADSSHADEEVLHAEVNEEVQAVYQAYVDVVEGRAALAPLSLALQNLEFSLLEAQALIEPAVEEDPDNEGRKMLFEAVNQALAGLQRMHAVEQNRQTRELHLGWRQLFEGSATLTMLLPGLRDEDED